MENIEGINNVPVFPEETPKEVFVPKKEPEEEIQLNSENLAKEGELRRAKNMEEGDEEYLSVYMKALDEVEEKVLSTFE